MGDGNIGSMIMVSNGGSSTIDSGMVGAIAVAMGDDGEKATRWKTAMAAAQSRWATVAVAQRMVG